MRKADNLTTILCRCHEIWEPELPRTLWAARAFNGTDLPIPLYLSILTDESAVDPGSSLRWGEPSVICDPYAMYCT